MRVYIRKKILPTVLMIIIFCVKVFHFPAQIEFLNIIEGDKLPRIYPDECLRVIYKEENSGETTSWITCLKKNDLMTDHWHPGEGWEPDHGKCIATILKKYPKAAYLDIGSNIGPHVCLASKFVNRVYALDPSKENLAYIRRSLLLENNEDKAVFINNVVSNETVELFPYQPYNHHQGETFWLDIKEIKGRQNFASSDPLKSVTLSQVLSAITEDTIIIKIDVEGSECKVFNDFLNRENKVKIIPYILMEWVNVQVNREGLCPDIQALIQTFLKSGYLPMTVEHLSSIKPIRLSALSYKRSNGEKHCEKAEIKTGSCADDVLWVHKQAL